MKFILGKPFISSFVFAIIFTILHHFVIYLPGLPSDKAILVNSTSFRKEIRSQNSSFDELDSLKKNFLLIDISNDVDIVCDSTRADTIGVPNDPGTKKYNPCYSRTDIVKLTGLFKWLADSANRNKYNLIVCDIIFDRMELLTKEDTTLLRHILAIQNHPDLKNKIIFASIYDSYNKSFNTADFSNFLKPENKGAVNEEKGSTAFFRYNLTHNNGKVKSLPLLMFERIDGVNAGAEKLGFYRYKKISDSYRKFANDLFIPEMYFLNEHIDTLITPGNYLEHTSTDSTVNKIELWQTLLCFQGKDNYYLDEALSGSPKKNIFIGSFNHKNPDVHKTMYGDMDGGTILLNIYFNLIDGKNDFKASYLLFIFCFFYLISFTIIHPFQNPYKGRFFLWKITLDAIVNYIQYYILVIVTIISNICFNTVTNILAMAGLIAIITTLLKKYKKHREEQLEKDLYDLPKVRSN